MSTQLEFIMQLYMMNLLQQQQQQQQPQLPPSLTSQAPAVAKAELITSSTTQPLLSTDDRDLETATATTTTTRSNESRDEVNDKVQQQLQSEDEEQEQQSNEHHRKTRLTRMQTRKQNISAKPNNCSSSGRSCSPNSNSSLNLLLTPFKAKDSLEATATTTTTSTVSDNNTFVPSHQTPATVTALPFSSSSIPSIHNQAALQQMLLNNFPASLTQLMLQQQQQQQLIANLATPSNLLTPTTPNSKGGCVLSVPTAGLSNFFSPNPTTLPDYALNTNSFSINNKNFNHDNTNDHDNGIAQNMSMNHNNNNNLNSNLHSLYASSNRNFPLATPSVSTSMLSSSLSNCSSLNKDNANVPDNDLESLGHVASDGHHVDNKSIIDFETVHTTSANLSFSAHNFLQSSTVTSTPTDAKSLDTSMENEDETSSKKSVKVNGALRTWRKRHQSLMQNSDASESKINAEEQSDEMHDSAISMGTNGVKKKRKNRKDDAPLKANITADVDEDDLPLSSLHTTSSGIVSTIGSSVESNLGIQNLETTNDSTMDSTANMPYTPIKQEADSSLSSAPVQFRQSLEYLQASDRLDDSQHHQESATALNDEANMTPMTIKNAILTPPSSEQITQNSYEKRNPKTTNKSQSFESGSRTTTPIPTINATTGSSLDAFLQNEENLKNVKKFSSYLECENPLCRQENLREHFHCFDEPCKGKILSKKDDIIRHLKWHKKRKESLLLGFARFSSSDDCAPSYGAGCAYNWKQTHYHCVYDECPKVYVSTSDVQMHANFHRKNSEIVQEGFRRFRAHEDCKIEDCPFYGKKTSHYHCCREGCNHTFKNKADMEKHKSYHLKDYQLTQDGFKKILKTEPCPFEDCKFSTVSNHIHCVRENCNYILHSSSQMISHKRKHDRADTEQAYQNFKCKKESSEDESPTTTAAATTTTTTSMTAMTSIDSAQLSAMVSNGNSSDNVSTPLSSHSSTESFLSRKRGRPPKMFQLPHDNADTKRQKLDFQQLQAEQLLNFSNILSNLPNPAAAAAAAAASGSLYPPYLSNFNSAAAAAAMQAQDPNAPNFQMTHLMALFQLQNPLFYQNLYPGGMANMLAAAATGSMPSTNNPSVFNNLAAFSAAAAAAAAAANAAPSNGLANLKHEFSDKQQ